MTEQEEIILKKMLITMSAYYGKSLTDDVVRMYVEDLKDIPFDRLMEVSMNYRRDQKNRQMFLPAALRALVFPAPDSKDLARFTVMRIQEAVSKFGYTNPSSAKEFIGETGWRVVEHYGGWLKLCESLGDDIQTTTFLAQGRDAIESLLNLKRAGIDTQRPAIEQTRDLVAERSRNASMKGLTPIAAILPKELK